MPAQYLIAIVVLIMIALLSGVWLLWRSTRPQPLTVPVGAKSGDLVNQYSNSYKTKTTTYLVDCGTLIVPENRSNPEARLIALPVRRIRSASSTPAEPIFHLSGGPGQGNMGYKPADALLAQHDLVLVGYRGADGSTVLNCPEMRPAFYGDGQDVTSPASLALSVTASRACAARLQAEGVDLAGYTIPEVVADLEAARIALGYAKIHLLSQSYGTRVAQIYAHLYPQAISRSAMIGVNPPGRFVWEADMIEQQLEQYSQLWANDDACRQHTPDLSAAMRQVAHNMPRRWLFVEIDPGKVKIITFIFLYHRRTAAIVFDAWVAAAKGDPSGLAFISLVFDQVMPNIFIWGDLAAKGGSADYDPQRDYNDLRVNDTILGSPLALFMWGSLEGWPIYPMADQFRQVHPSEVETLLINGNLDFSTPGQYGRDALLPSLKRGKWVTLAEMGHCNDFWTVNGAAANQLLTSFYTTGQADDSGFGYMPMEFKVSLGLPTLAKILLGTGILPALWAILKFKKKRFFITTKPAA